VRGLGLLDARKLLGVAVLGAYQSAPFDAGRQARAKNLLHGPGHARGGLAAPQHQDARETRQVHLVARGLKLDNQARAIEPHALLEHAIGVDAHKRSLKNPP